MVKYSSASLDATMSALAHPTRRSIIAMLTQGESSVTELARPFDFSLPAISKHLKVLERAGLIARKKDGRVHRCRLVAAPLKEAADWLATYRRFWEEQFTALADYLAQSERMEET